MVAVRDDFAWRAAEVLIDQLGEAALRWAIERAIDLAERGDPHGAGMWEVIAFAVAELKLGVREEQIHYEEAGQSSISNRQAS